LRQTFLPHLIGSTALLFGFQARLRLGTGALWSKRETMTDLFDDAEDLLGVGDMLHRGCALAFFFATS
jgi:hypothetical protein